MLRQLKVAIALLFLTDFSTILHLNANKWNRNGTLA